MAYEQTFAALADPTRRRVFEKLSSGPKSVGAIARGLPVSRPAVSQHLRVLKVPAWSPIMPRGRGGFTPSTRMVLDYCASGSINSGTRLCTPMPKRSQNRRGRADEQDEQDDRTGTGAQKRTPRRAAGPCVPGFHRRLGRWWPKSHHIGRLPISTPLSSSPKPAGAGTSAASTARNARSARFWYGSRRPASCCAGS